MSKVNISLTKDEAIVLFELLSRFSEIDKLEIQCKSEEQVLWNIQAKLEKILAEPFSKEYKYLLERARENLNYE